jgi:DNA processing protein
MKDSNRIHPDENTFLQRTAVLDNPAKQLWFKGTLPDDLPTVAIVGSRKPTAYGREVTLKLASGLAARGVIIVSGLAVGHDALAHRGALDAGGATVAVIGSGFDHFYPKANWRLAEEIIAGGGAILTEYPPETEVKPWQFLERNRLVSGLADVVIVVEAGERSGTLNTAAHAIAQNRELMAVPGNITSPLSIGCNRLISAGATPVLSVNDVMEKLRELYEIRHFGVPNPGIDAILGVSRKTDPRHSELDSGSSPTTRKTGDKNQDLLLKLLTSGIRDGDELLRKSHLSASDFSVALTMLELSNLVRSLGANNWGLV